MPAEKIPGWIERLLLPDLNEMKGELKAINTRIDSTNERIDSLRNEMNSMRNETEAETASLRIEMTVRLDSLEKRIPVIEELTA